VAGAQNVVAVALSRPAAAVAVPASQSVDYEQMARLNATCGETQELAWGCTLQVQTAHMAGSAVLCDSSTGVLRPLVVEESSVPRNT
jgi:hypothetical protein